MFFGLDIKRSVGGVTRNEWFEIWLGHESNRIGVIHSDPIIKQLVLLVKEEKRKFTEVIRKTPWALKIPP